MRAHWRNIHNGDGGHYTTFALNSDGMAALRDLFPEARANEMNLALFSTSGVHGHYGTIEDVERRMAAGDEEEANDVTFLVVQPRLVTLRYGSCEPKDAADIAYLKALRASSHAEFAKIGMP